MCDLSIIIGAYFILQRVVWVMRGRKGLSPLSSFNFVLGVCGFAKDKKSFKLTLLWRILLLIMNWDLQHALHKDKGFDRKHLQGHASVIIYLFHLSNS